ncbi:MAG: DUF11 domain-containing protein [Bifidobacteriaceae bacterium]|nr:DUF11 domain-containing protein [Bifidobacteriaceae bacterium]
MSLVAANARTVAEAATTAPFDVRYTTNANGAILSIGNNLMTCEGASTSICERAKAGGSYDNNNFVMANLDADSDTTTFNSSSSALALPDGASVLFAGLYWGARLDAGSSGAAGNVGLADRMAFKIPGETAYRSITGTVIARNTGQQNAYQAFMDVTTMVRAAGNGDYWGANVQAATGYDRYAGWALTIAYTAPGYPLRNLTIFDGFNTVGSGYPQTIRVSGFTAPLDGPVDAQLSMVAYEGDLAQTGDYTVLNQTQLATAVSPGSNFFDSINSLAGASVTTRTPAYRNMLGFDIKNLGASGVISNGASQATFSFSSAGDVYYPGMLALAINLYAPDFTSSTKTAVNLTSSDGAKPGDTLQYQLTYTNTGQDPAAGSQACDPLPTGVVYVPNSMVLLSAPGTAAVPAPLPDDGSGLGRYDAAARQICVNLGRGATPTAGGTLNVGDQTSFQFQVTVSDDAGGTTVHNIAHLAYTTGTTGVPAVFDTPPAVTSVALKADVSLTKAIAPTDAIAGAGSATTLSVTNAGPNRATGVVVTDPLPPDYVATAVTWSSATGGLSGACPVPAAGAAVVCPLPDMPSGQVIRVVISGAVASSSLATTLSNVASVTTSSFDPDPNNNVASASVSMTHQADIKIEKIPSSTTVTPGGRFTWTVKVTNECSSVTPTNPSGCMSDAMGVSISDVVPDTTKLVLLDVTGGSGTGGAQGDVPVTCLDILQSATAFTCLVDDGGRIKPGQSAIVTAAAYIMGNLTPGSGAVANNASTLSGTFDPVPANNLATASVLPGPAVNDVQVIKTGPASVTAGRRVNYTVTAQNFGPSDAAMVQVLDDLAAAGLTADSSTQAVTDRGTCSVTTGAASMVTCDIGTLPGPGRPGNAGAMATITITGALVPADAAPSSFITNTASVTCAGAACPEPPGPDPHPDTPSAPSEVTGSADLAVVKTSNLAGLSENDKVTYTMTVSNLGPSRASGVTLTDVLPGGVVAGTMGVAGGANGTCVAATGVCSIPTLEPGETSQITLTATVDPGGTTSSVETATVTATTPDPVAANNVATWTHGPGQADLVIAKTSSWTGSGSTAGPIAGSTGQYHLVVRNLGPNYAAGSVVITDDLPPNVTVDPAGSLPNSCGVDGVTGEVTCTRDTGLNVGDPWSVTIPVVINSGLAAHTPITNTATVTSTTDDPTLANNTATVTDVVNTVTDVAIDYQIGYGVTESPLAVVPAPPPDTYQGPGSTRWMLIILTNTGPSTARNIQVLSNVAITAIPDQTSFPEWCEAVNQELVCSFDNNPAEQTLPPGSTLSLAVTFTVGPGTSEGTFADCGRAPSCPNGPGGWASVTTSTPDADAADNFDTAALDIAAPQTDLHMTKTALSTIPNPNEQANPHDAYVAGQKFGYRMDLWIPATYDEVDEIDLAMADAADVTLTDTVPQGFLVTQVSSSQGTCDTVTSPVPEVSCALGTVRASINPASPQLVTVYVYGTIAPDAEAEIDDVGGGAVNQAVATSPTPDVEGEATEVRANAATDVIQQGDLQVAKLADTQISYAGASVGYTITTLNSGPSDVDDAEITDTLPEGLTLDPALSPGCAVDHFDAVTGRHVVTCTPGAGGSEAGTVEANTSVNTRIVATSDPRDLRPYWCPGQDQVVGAQCPEVLPPVDEASEHPRDLVNDVTVTASATDTNPDNNTASVTTVMETLADIAVTASVSTDTPSAGTEITYTLNGVNSGPSTLDYPVVEATFPPGFQVVTVTEPYMNCTVIHTGVGADAADMVRCVGWEVTPIRDSFQPGITVPGTVTVLIPADASAGAYTATARAYSRVPIECPDSAATGTCESDYSNNATSVTVNVVQVADTAITKRLVSPIPIEVGRQVVYDVDVTNAGPSIANGVTISDTVPTGLTYVSGTVLGGDDCASPQEIDEHNVVRCSAGSLTIGQTVTARLVFSVDTDFMGDMCNTTLAGSGALDHDAVNNTSTACSPTVVPVTDEPSSTTSPSGDPSSSVSPSGDPSGDPSGGGGPSGDPGGGTGGSPYNGGGPSGGPSGGGGGGGGPSSGPTSSADTSPSTTPTASGSPTPSRTPTSTSKPTRSGGGGDESGKAGGSDGSSDGDIPRTGANLVQPGGLAAVTLLLGAMLVARRARQRASWAPGLPRHGV